MSDTKSSKPKKNSNNKTKNDEEITKNILESLKNLYPREVAKKFKMPTSRVYKLIEGLNDEERKAVLRNGVRANPIFEKVREIKNKNNTTYEKALMIFEKTVPMEDIRHLARIYYLLGKTGKALDIINTTLENNEQDSIDVQKLRKERSKILAENIAQSIRKEYMRSHRITDKSLYLCKKYSLSTAFVKDVIDGYDFSEKNEKDYIVVEKDIL